MPRKRSKKIKDKPKEKVQPKADPTIRGIVKPEPIKVPALGEEQLKALDKITYELYTRFIRSDEEIIVVAYEVPTMRLIGEDQIRNWKLGLETALVQAANNKRLKITRDKFQFKALPQGEITLLKAFFRMADVTGGAGKEQHLKQQPPRGKEGLIVEA